MNRAFIEQASMTGDLRGLEYAVVSEFSNNDSPGREEGRGEGGGGRGEEERKENSGEGRGRGGRERGEGEEGGRGKSLGIFFEKL